jgi:hypothetical protein
VAVRWHLNCSPEDVEHSIQEVILGRELKREEFLKLREDRKKAEEEAEAHAEAQAEPRAAKRAADRENDPTYWKGLYIREVERSKEREEQWKVDKVYLWIISICILTVLVVKEFFHW